MRSTSSSTYRRLPGRRRRLGVLLTAARYSLWLGADHVLQVENRFYSEEYRRFYYRDIQMLLVRRSAHWIVWNVLWGLLLTAGVFLGLQVGGLVGQGLGAALAGLGLVVILVNSLYGPTCACQVHTAVQTVALPSLNRLRHVRKTLAQLQPLIAQAQGELSPDMLAAGWVAVSPGPARQATASRRRQAPATRLQPFRPGRHATLFALLLLDGLTTLFTFQHSSVTVLLAIWGIMLGIFIAILMALIMQQQSDCPKGLRLFTWVVGGYVCLLYVSRTVPWTIISMQTSRRVVSTWDILRLLALQSPYDNMYVYVASFVVLLGSLGLGAFGCFLLVRTGLQQSAPPPFPVPTPPAL